MSKTLEDLGYEEIEKDIGKNDIVLFRKGNHRIAFFLEEREVYKDNVSFVDGGYITMEELKAIYQYCIDNKWI